MSTTTASIEGEALDALYATGFWLHEQARYEDAAHVFRGMLVAAPRDERGWLALGDCHEQLAQPGIAIELYAMGCAAASPSVRCQLALSRSLGAMNRDDEAEVARARAIEIAEKSGCDELLALARQGRKVSS